MGTVSSYSTQSMGTFSHSHAYTSDEALEQALAVDGEEIVHLDATHQPALKKRVSFSPHNTIVYISKQESQEEGNLLTQIDQKFQGEKGEIENCLSILLIVACMTGIGLLVLLLLRKCELISEETLAPLPNWLRSYF